MGGHQNGIGIGRLRTLVAELITTPETCRSLAVADVIVVALVLLIDFDFAAVVEATRRRDANRSAL